MALFDAPLTKPGNKKCPCCGSFVWWASMWWGFSGSSAFLCSRCGAELKVDIKRSLLGWVVCAAYGALWVGSLRFGWGEWAFFPLMYAGGLFFILAQWWFTSVRLSEKVPLEQVEWWHPPWYKPGNKRCPNCGTLVRQNTVWHLRATQYCTNCGAALRRDFTRAIAGVVVAAAFLAATVGVLAVMVWSVVSRDFNGLPGWYAWTALLWCAGPWLEIMFIRWWAFSVKQGDKVPLKPSIA